jgi:hypothetical protein
MLTFIKNDTIIHHHAVSCTHTRLTEINRRLCTTLLSDHSSVLHGEDGVSFLTMKCKELDHIPEGGKIYNTTLTRSGI